jgi:knotted carbamoyltransferase YgeW
MKTVRDLINKLSKKKIGIYGKDFLQTWDKSNEQLEATMLVAEIFKEMRKINISPKIYDSGLAVSWFRDKSTRTRFSFKSAANLLGLSVQDLDEEKSQISHGETVRESANMISFLTEVIGIRDDKFLGEGHVFQKEVADAVKEGFKDGILPQRPSIINLQSDRDHPTQSLSDFLHLKHFLGGLNKLQGKKIVMSWAYSPSYGKPLSVAQGICGMATRFGMEVVLAYPKGYNLVPELEKLFIRQAKESNGSFAMTHNMKSAFEGAEIVYPKSWASYEAMQERTILLKKCNIKGLEKLEQKELQENSRHKDWECNEKMMKLTKKGKALYMHCLPADVSGLNCKQGEVSDSVFERYREQTFTEAGYKPYIIAAMMMLTKIKKPEKILRSVLRRKKLIKYG